MTLSTKTLSHRSVITGSAAVVTAIPAVGLAAGVSDELNRLIEAHRAAHLAFGEAIDAEAAHGESQAREVHVPCVMGDVRSVSGYSRNTCAERIASVYASTTSRLKSALSGVDPKLLKAALAETKMRHKEAKAALERIWKESGRANVEERTSQAGDADLDTFAAVSAYRCRSLEEARHKAEFLLSTDHVHDTWEEDAQALLRSFVNQAG